ncbi:MAG TPA: DUF3592 domain-containing protein [Burkholderiales bacterium]
MFGLVAGLGAIMALFATVSDWRDEAAQARWPVVSASIERGSADPHRVSQSSGGGTVWQLHYRVRYEADGERIATLASRSTGSDEEVAKLRAWAAEHRRGGRIDIRYDPSQPGRAVFASADVPNAGPRAATDFRLLIVAATLCVVLMTLARHLSSREADAALAADSGKLSPGGRIAMGLAVAAMGFLVIGLGVHAALVATHALTSEDFIGVPAGMIFVFGGAMLALPSDRAGLQRLIGTLLVTTFALVLDWVAFGPGTRQFGGGISFGILGIGFHPGEIFGRTVFGIAAVCFDIAAAVMWVLLVRPAKAPGETANS